MSPLRRVGKPAVEISNEVENMNTIKGFGQWVGEDFFDVYIKFHHNYNFFFKIDAEKHSKMSRVDRCKELLKRLV